MSTLVDVLATAALRWSDPDHPARVRAVKATLEMDNRFTEEAIIFAVNQQMSLLTPEALERWQKKLAGVATGAEHHSAQRVVGVLNPGNIPMVELQDLVAVLLAGFAWRGTVSSRSSALLPAFLDELRTVADGRVPVDAQVTTLQEVLDEAWGLMASGSDDTLAEVTSLALEAGIPASRQWMRGHRFSIAILDGGEDEEERLDLAEDALLHEGQGCRSAALIFATATQGPDEILDAFATFRGTFPAHPATSGSLKMQQAFLEALDAPHAWADGMAFLISRGEAELQQPGHIRWVPYESPDIVTAWVGEHRNALQAVYTRRERAGVWSERLSVVVEPLGTAQRPELDWNPDGRSHADFFNNLLGRV
ncbi:MAG: acyl-CoA reductase [Rhodothermales bacterium]